MIEIIAVKMKVDVLPDIMYKSVVDGKELSCLGETEDVALLLGLEYKYDGINSQFTKMACRMLKIDSRWSE